MALNVSDLFHGYHFQVSCLLCPGKRYGTAVTPVNERLVCKGYLDLSLRAFS